MISMQRTKRIVVVSVVTFFAAVATYVYVIYYIKNLSNEVAKLQSSVAEANDTATKQREIEKVLEETSGDRDRINQFFIGGDSAAQADFLNNIEELATSTAKVTLENVSFTHEDIKDSKVFEYAILRGDVRGTLPRVYQFLRLLEVYPVALKVNEIQMEALPLVPKQKQEWRLAFVVKALKFK